MYFFKYNRRTTYVSGGGMPKQAQYDYTIKIIFFSKSIPNEYYFCLTSFEIIKILHFYGKKAFPKIRFRLLNCFYLILQY